MIVVVGLSHQTAPIAVRERVALAKEEVLGALDEVLSVDQVGEAAILSTCNRIEIYGALGRNVEPTVERLDHVARGLGQTLIRRGGRDVERALRYVLGEGALRHLFRVASSLDSLVVGEPQILGQLKDAVSVAQARGTVGPILGRALHRSLFVGKRVRTETNIGQGGVSVSSVAVDLGTQIFGELRGRNALLCGAGEMAESAAKLLVKEGALLTVCNRSPERAVRLASEVGGTARDWAELNWCLVEADIVITSTSAPHFVVTTETMKTVRKARRGRPIFFIDIALPRNVEPTVGKLDGVYLYDIDDLSRAVSTTLENRAVEAEKAESIVEAEVLQFIAKRAENLVAPTIVGLRAHTRAVLASELERSLSGKLKHLGEADRRALAAMVDAATNKLCHKPSTRLKELARDPRGSELGEALSELFDLPLPHGELGDETQEALRASDEHASPRLREEEPS